MTSCTIKGCRNLETRCKGCGRVVISAFFNKDEDPVCLPNTNPLDIGWIDTEKQPPPKDEPFLALTNSGIEKMVWIERVVDGTERGWFGFDCACACCSGFCSDEFSWWMPLPKPPCESLCRTQQNGIEGYQDDNQDDR